MKESEPRPQEISELEYRTMMGQIKGMAEQQIEAVEGNIDQLNWYQENNYRIKYFVDPETGLPGFNAVEKKWGFR